MICQNTKNSSLVYAPHLVSCPIENFMNYLVSIGETFPYSYDGDNDSLSFGSVYNDFMNSPDGSSANANALSFVQYDEDIGDYKVRFYAMNIYTTVTWNAASDVSRDEVAKWDDFIEDFSRDCPDGLCSFVENVSLRWCWLQSQTAFVQSAIQGLNTFFFVTSCYFDGEQVF